MKAFKGTLRLYAWAVGIVTVVLAAGMIILAHPIVQLLFQRGAFTPRMTDFTTEILIGNLIGLPPMAVGFLVARAFSALGKTRVLMWTTVFSVIGNAIFDYSFGLVWGTFGITLATSIVYYCTLVILVVTLRFTIGELNLLSPPEELPGLFAKFGLERFSRQINSPRNTSMLPLGIPYANWKLIIRGLIIGVAFVAVIIGVTQSTTLTLAVSFGAIVLLLLLRYPFMLLLCWASINAFIGSSLPLFNGAHLLSGMTIPTLLLLFYVPTKVAFKRMIALPILLIFIFLMLPTARISPLSLSDFFTQWTTLLDFVGVAVLVITLVNTRKRMYLLVDAIMIPAIFIALYGIYGYLIKQHGVVDTSTGFFRISSIFSDTPPTLAMFLSIVIPLALYRTFTLEGKKRILGACITILLLATLGLTFSRGPLIAVPVSMVLMILLIPSNKLRVGLLGSIVAGGAILILLGTLFNVPFLANIFSRFGNTDLTSLNGRTYLWQAIISHYDPGQMLGYGHHASDELLLNLKVGFGTGVIATAAHNIFLETMYDHGIIGVFFLILMFIALAVGLLRLISKATYEHRLVIAMAAAAYSSVLIQCFESNDIWNQGVGIYFMIALALPFALYWSAPRQQNLPVINQEVYERETAKHVAIRLTDEQKHMAQV